MELLLSDGAMEWVILILLAVQSAPKDRVLPAGRQGRYRLLAALAYRISLLSLLVQRQKSVLT